MPEGSGLMLKLLVRSEIKEAIILLVFSGLMVETLTNTTVLFVFIGAILVWLRKRPGATFRNILTLGLFATYWLTYGKVIDPEVGLNFLTSIIVLKLLEKETERDRYMIFFGLILLISAGSLFQKSITYVVFFALSFFILIQDFYKGLKLPTRILDLAQSLVWVLPFTVFLFFFAPRMINPFQIEKGTPREGEVGYTPEVNISQLESLTGNDSVVFQARVDRVIYNEELYWRGNTLTFTDGWNWPVMPQDRPQKKFIPNINYKTDGYKQSIRVFSQQDFFFALDHPTVFITPRGVAELDSNRSMVQSRWQPYLRYDVMSFSGGIKDNIPAEKHFTGLKPEERIWIQTNFKAKDLPGLQREIQSYFQKEGFSYSLAPGRVENFLSFMTDKKVGFCSHYSSAVGQILRAKRIPTRLVSGFMGGTYNKFAGFYQVTQNDAHVWVEALHDGKWIRLDPTGWIAPDRVRLGGEAFMQQSNAAEFSGLRYLGSRFRWISEFQQWFVQWDYRFNQWLEEMDYYGQEAFLEKLNFPREWIFSLIPVMLALFMGLYAWHLGRRKIKLPEIEVLWKSFQHKLNKRGIHLPLFSVAEGESILKSQDKEIKEIWQGLIEVSFIDEQEAHLRALKKKIQDL